jgi:hypothetical protein
VPSARSRFLPPADCLRRRGDDPHRKSLQNRDVTPLRYFLRPLSPTVEWHTHIPADRFVGRVIAGLPDIDAESGRNGVDACLLYPPGGEENIP